MNMPSDMPSDKKRRTDGTGDTLQNTTSVLSTTQAKVQEKTRQEEQVSFFIVSFAFGADCTVKETTAFILNLLRTKKPHPVFEFVKDLERTNKIFFRLQFSVSPPINFKDLCDVFLGHQDYELKKFCEEQIKERSEKSRVFAKAASTALLKDASVVLAEMTPTQSGRSLLHLLKEKQQVSRSKVHK